MRLICSKFMNRHLLDQTCVRNTSITAPMVSFDQEMGGAANFPCYNTSHGHPPGRGNWEWKALTIHF